LHFRKLHWEDERKRKPQRKSKRSCFKRKKVKKALKESRSPGGRRATKIRREALEANAISGKKMNRRVADAD